MQLPEHDITLEAAWLELFIDRNGKYWDVPESISLDVSYLIFDSGLRYRAVTFGDKKRSKKISLLRQRREGGSGAGGAGGSGSGSILWLGNGLDRAGSGSIREETSGFGTY
ncbi:hypothetical protein IFM89_038003 [Coptis chinensis]|uniref:Uncharacterized protein n=1 Tax=Coptis chinensis TaxID=261450 RepID=A0A835M2X4_9MAGN|nr:hypothetical protein IFM89_038003 [Coptis chinensis]